MNNNHQTPAMLAVIKSHIQIIECARRYNVPCYVAASKAGMSTIEYVNGVMGLESAKDTDILPLLKGVDFDTYVQAINEDRSNLVLLDLYKPIFQFPQGGADGVTTLRVSFDSVQERASIKGYMAL